MARTGKIKILVPLLLHFSIQPSIPFTPPTFPCLRGTCRITQSNIFLFDRSVLDRRSALAKLLQTTQLSIRLFEKVDRCTLRPSTDQGRQTCVAFPHAARATCVTCAACGAHAEADNTHRRICLEVMCTVELSPPRLSSASAAARQAFDANSYDETKYYNHDNNSDDNDDYDDDEEDNIQSKLMLNMECTA